MDLAALQARAKATTTVKIGDNEWTLGKIMAPEMFALRESAAAVADDDSPESKRFALALIRQGVLNGEGPMFAGLELDAIAGLLTLREVSELPQAILRFNGLGDDAKKN